MVSTTNKRIILAAVLLFGVAFFFGFKSYTKKVGLNDRCRRRRLMGTAEDGTDDSGCIDLEEEVPQLDVSGCIDEKVKRLEEEVAQLTDVFLEACDKAGAAVKEAEKALARVIVAYREGLIDMPEDKAIAATYKVISEARKIGEAREALLAVKDELNVAKAAFQHSNPSRRFRN